MSDRPDDKAPETGDAPERERRSEDLADQHLGDQDLAADQGLGDQDLGDQDLVDKTELMADRAIERLVSEVGLPDVRAEVGRAQAFFSSIQSPFLWWLVVFYIASAAVGVGVVLVGVEPVGTLPDWYMHAAMYVVIFSFLILYVKAHLQRRRFGRALFALFTLGQMSFFAWVLADLVAPRSIVAVTDAKPVAIERPAMELLQLPMWLLLVCAAWLAIHWVILVHFRLPIAPAGSAETGAEAPPSPPAGAADDGD